MTKSQYKVDEGEFINLYMSDVPGDEIARRFGITQNYVYTLMKRYHLPHRRINSRPVPEGFVEDAPNMTYNALKIKYGAHPSILSRWAAQTGVVVGVNATTCNSIQRPPPPEDFVQQARFRPVTGELGLAKHYRVARGLIEHWLSECGISEREKSWRLSEEYKRSKSIPASVLDAAHFLRKSFRNVHSTDIPMWELCDKSIPNTWWFSKGLGPDASGKYYVSGEGIVSQDWILETAKRRGWRGEEISYDYGA